MFPEWTLSLHRIRMAEHEDRLRHAARVNELGRISGRSAGRTRTRNPRH